MGFEFKCQFEKKKFVIVVVHMKLTSECSAYKLSNYFYFKN